MQKKSPFLLLLYLCIVCVTNSAQAGYVIHKGSFVDEKLVPTMSVQEHFSEGMNAIKERDWKKAIRQMQIVMTHFADSPFARDALFYLGAAYFNRDDLQQANEQFSHYLKRESSPKHFEEVFQYKFAIAEKFRHGSRTHLLGWEAMPKILPASDDALVIYEEIITALPSHDLAAKSLFAKATLLHAHKEFSDSIECFQTLIGRFPRHPLTPDSYLSISELYLEQSHQQSHDPDLLGLAHVNLRKFRQEFPIDEKILQAEKYFSLMKEVYAKALYETGQFFERVKKPNAAILYYSSAVREYPGTKASRKCKRRLSKIAPGIQATSEEPSIDMRSSQTKGS
jgi:outer membrane protein assembly factor BamD (BamD/ComL family)